MKKTIVFTLAASAVFFVHGQEEEIPLKPQVEEAVELEAPAPVRTIGTIERLDERINALIPQDAAIVVLAEGFDWAEGPVWNKREQYLLFSDIPPNTVFKWKEGEGISEFLKPSGYTGPEEREGEPGSNGLLYDAGGNLILCQHGDRRIARWTPGAGFETVVQYHKYRRFNSPNDAAFKSNGDLYFTDPPYGLEGKNQDPLKELLFNGVYRFGAGGKVTLLDDDLTFPNGIGFSPDENTLYVAVSDPDNPVIMAYDVTEDGTVENKRVFFDASALRAQGLKGLPDGLKVDQRGNVFATGPGGVLVLSPEGDHLGTLNTGEATANCGWGNDGSVLYITADMYLCRVQTSTVGTGFPVKSEK